MNLNVEKEMELIEKNLFFLVVLTKSINKILKEEIKEEEKVAHPFNMNRNSFKSHWRPVSYKKFLPSDKRPLDPNSFKNNYKNRPMKDERHIQPRFIVPQSTPPNKQWQRKEHRKFSQSLTLYTQKERL